MQQPPQMIPMVPSFPPTNITTEQIQKYLDENKKLIMAILENQNLGKLAECAQYQALLQKNLMYLAAIADAQPQSSAPPPAPAVAPQMAPHPGMQPQGYFMQQAQPGIFPLRGPFPPHQLQDPQAMQGPVGIRPMGINHNALHHHPVTTPGNVGSKQDGSDAGQGGSATRHGHGHGHVDGRDNGK